MFQQSSDYISRSITTHQGARHGNVDHGGASDGVFLLLHLWVLPSIWAILLRRSPSSLSLACGWPLGVNGSLYCEWRCLQGFRVEDPSSARKVGAEPTPGLGQAGRFGSTGPGPSQPSSVTPSLPWVLM
jgi:hypothetical protein